MLAGLSLGFSRSDLVVLARQDYVVRSVRVDSKAETWNATFSRMFLMSGNAGSVKDFLQHGAPPVLQGAARPAGQHAISLVGNACTCSSSMIGLSRQHTQQLLVQHIGTLTQLPPCVSADAM